MIYKRKVDVVVERDAGSDDVMGFRRHRLHFFGGEFGGRRRSTWFASLVVCKASSHLWDQSKVYLALLPIKQASERAHVGSCEQCGRQECAAGKIRNQSLTGSMGSVQVIGSHPNDYLS